LRFLHYIAIKSYCIFVLAVIYKPGEIWLKFLNFFILSFFLYFLLWGTLTIRQLTVSHSFIIYKFSYLILTTFCIHIILTFLFKKISLVKAFLKICEHDSDCVRSICLYPEIVRCINKSCECVRMIPWVLMTKKNA
jgi:hypothetical protein